MLQVANQNRSVSITGIKVYYACVASVHGFSSSRTSTGTWRKCIWSSLPAFSCCTGTCQAAAARIAARLTAVMMRWQDRLRRKAAGCCSSCSSSIALRSMPPLLSVWRPFPQRSAASHALHGVMHLSSNVDTAHDGLPASSSFQANVLRSMWLASHRCWCRPSINSPWAGQTIRDRMPLANIRTPCHCCHRL